MEKNRFKLRWLSFGLWVGATLLSVIPVATASGTEETLAYRLKWIFNASVLGDIYAETEGFFTREGLRVNVKAGGPERDAIMELELGRCQFGVASADQVIRALSKGANLVVLAQLFQINPLQWMYRPDHMQIRTLGDLKGQRLGVTFGGNDETILRSLLVQAGIAETDVEWFSVRNDFTPFLKKKVHFWPVYRNTQAVFLETKLATAGEPSAYFDPAAHGVKFVANSVITSRAFFDKHPEVARRFMKGLIAGWESALDPKNQERAIQVLSRYEKGSAPEVLKKQIELTRGLVQPNLSTPIGTLDIAAWRQTETIMLQQHQIDAPIHIENALQQTLPD